MDLRVFLLHIYSFIQITQSSMKQPKDVGITGRLWCHVGTRREYAPQQCNAGVEECFIFRCDGGQHDFLVRGCGVSMLTNGTGLPDESCWQAQSVCQYLGGSSNCTRCANKHMCNSTPSLSIPFSLLLFIISLFLSSISP